MKFDIIGDIHGHAKQLRELLGKLGYSEKNGHYKHSELDRKAIFVGDFIDRGPEIRETLSIVTSMVENGTAKAVMGNHEYNALCFHTKQADPSDSWLRPHTDKNINQHSQTLRQFKDKEYEWKEYLAWFTSLPLFLDLDDIRIVHSSWIPSEIDKIYKWTSGNLKITDDLLQRTAKEGTEEFQAIEWILKGVEIPLPKGEYFDDKDGNLRQEIRTRWWESAGDRTYGEMVFPEISLDCGTQKIDRKETANLSAYNDSVPIFFGHYWLTHNPPRIQKKYICCLDYSVANEGILVAYRWEGEKTLKNNRFVWV